MHVVVVGAGAIGTLYGGWLLAAGGDVSFVARGAQLEALRTTGLELTGELGDYSQSRISAAREPGDLRPADVLLFAVKAYDLETAALATRSGLADGGLAVGLQNGVEAAETLARVFPPEQVMAGAVTSPARLVRPGAVAYLGTAHSVALGHVQGLDHPHARELVRLWRRAGVAASLESDIRAVLWAKFLGFATNAALTCLTRQAAGVVYHDPDLLALARRSVEEVAAVARAEGVSLPPGAVADTLSFLQAFPPDVVASMRQDLDAGRRLELESASGAVVRRGRAHGVATPFHETAYACLKPYRDGAPGSPAA